MLTTTRWLQALSISYGVFSGLRGFSFSILNSDLIQNLRCVCRPPPFPGQTCPHVCRAQIKETTRYYYNHSMGMGGLDGGFMEAHAGQVWGAFSLLALPGFSLLGSTP